MMMMMNFCSRFKSNISCLNTQYSIKLIDNDKNDDEVLIFCSRFKSHVSPDSYRELKLITKYS